ncbi:MAG: Arc family DNA binding domain-containing protein [Gemmatimonadaceae bacterium]
MAERKSFLLRVDRDTLDAVQRWANDDLRSLNGQVEFLLRRALQQARRAPTAGESSTTTIDNAASDSTRVSEPE